MLSKLSRSQSILLSSLLLAACASPHSTNGDASGTAAYYEASFNDHNRAPASMSPPIFQADNTDNLDPVYLRTQADYYFQVGEAQSLDGQHQKAVEAFKMVLVYDSNSSQVHLRLAAEYVKLGMLTQALEHAEIAVKKNPTSADARVLLGGLYSTLKVYDKALAQYEEVMKLDSANTEAPMYIGAVYAEQKQYDKAAKYFEKLAKNEDYATPYLAWYYVGRIRSEQDGKAFEKAAVAAFQKSISLKPSYVDSVIALGALYSKNEKESKAIELYKNYQREFGPNARLAEILSQSYLEQEKYDLAFEQLEIVEANAEDALAVKMKMALILIEQKKFEGAISKLKDVLRQVPDSDKIRFYLAAIYEEMGKTPEAIENFTRVPDESQYYGEATVHAAYMMKQSGQIDQAIALIKQGLAKRNDIAQFYALYASLLDEKGDYKQAASVLNDGAKKFPDNVQLQFFLGTIQDRLGDKKKVVEHMKAVIEMDPNHVQGLNYLAFTYAEGNGDLEEAENLVRRALKIEPQDGFILDTLGWILYKKGKFQDSIKVLEAAVKNQPKEAIIAEHLGDAYNKNQLVEKARQMYKRAAETETDERKLREIKEKITALDRQELRLSERQPASVQPEPTH
jgi:tetratricopeptide (TPR) repeat protein